MLLFSSEVSGNLTPLGSFPFDDGVAEGIGAEPVLGTGDDLVQLFCFGIVGKGGLTTFLVYPQDGIVAVAVDGFAYSHLLLQGQGVNDGQELPDVVGAKYRTEMEYLLTCGKVNA